MLEGMTPEVSSPGYALSIHQGTGESMTHDPEAPLAPGTRAVTGPCLSFSNFKMGMFSFAPGTPRLRGRVVEQPFAAGMVRQMDRQIGDAKGQAGRDTKKG